MFIFPALNIVLWVYILAALIPAVYLMIYIYRQDSIEKEPPGLLWACVCRGVLAALLSIILETLGSVLMALNSINTNTAKGVMIEAFLVVAVVEEGTKYLLMSRITWRNPEFNCRFDGIVYAAFTSLGFAAFENIEYVFQYGLKVAVPRAFLSIPGHLGFAVVFGCFYGRAKLARDMGDRGRMKADLAAGYILAVFLHGLYDTCAMIQSSKSTVIFVAVVLVLYFIVFRIVKHESRTDQFV